MSKDLYVDEEKATEEIAYGLTYNEIHSFYLGSVLGVLIGFLYGFTPTLGAILIVDMALGSVGISFISMIADIYPPNIAFKYTIRAEPWYYLIPLMLFFFLSVFVF